MRVLASLWARGWGERRCGIRHPDDEVTPDDSLRLRVLASLRARGWWKDGAEFVIPTMK
ncbi:hypothetical protein SD208_18280 [Ochrobactrum sp. BD67]